MNTESDDWFYDNLFELHKETFVEVERIYCLNLNLFSASHWSQISEIYQLLPNWIGYEKLPYWFGYDEENPPFLTASAEPSGLQVYGILAQTDWQKWDSIFREFAKSLPKQIIN